MRIRNPVCRDKAGRTAEAAIALLSKTNEVEKMIIGTFLSGRNRNNMYWSDYLRQTFGKSENFPYFCAPIGRDARVVEEARLESVYTPKGYPGFESPSLRIGF